MAMETANAAAPPATSPPPTPGQLWQVPVFVAGLLAVAGAWAYRHQVPTDWQPAEREVALLLRALEQVEPPADILALAERLADQAARFPEEAGTAHLLLGSYCLGRADRPDPQKARQHLEQAKQIEAKVSSAPAAK